MKKIYDSPELEIVKFTALEAVAAGGDNPFSVRDDDVFDTLPIEDTEEF